MKNKKEKIIQKLFNIRSFEESLDILFSKGKIFGTYHRCIGQEATAIAFTEFLDRNNDYVVSNHRNHGHYLAFTEDYKGLMKELMGKEDGVSSGRGGSQVIFGKNFLSNGIIGSTIPVATGISFGLKIKKKKNCVVCFVGDGALGQGVVYESFNMASLYNLPILFVVELNNIAQSTKIDLTTSGSIEDRFKSFDIGVKKVKSTNVFKLLEIAKNLTFKVKKQKKPYAIIIEAERLCAHSKGDDYRKKIDKTNDPINMLVKKNKNSSTILNNSKNFINKMIIDINNEDR